MIERLRAAKAPGVLFSGGAMRCIFQVGVIETLVELGVTPAAVLGVSGGVWNAAALAVGNAHRLRKYWRFFARMPYLDVTNLLREHSPFIWTRLHARAFDRYVGSERISRSSIPLYVGLTRLRDRSASIVDVRSLAEPFKALIASNYLPPFFTHPVSIDGERYGDGGLSNNIPYEALFERGCDVVVLISTKGESEGGLHRNLSDCDHLIAPEYRDRVIVIRPRHRLPLGFVERKWKHLARIADVGALRAREVLLGERHLETDLAARGLAPSAYVSWVFSRTKRPRKVL